MEQITVQLRDQVISNLKVHVEQNNSIDFYALQDIADSSQDQAVLALMQLQQKLITSAPSDNMVPIAPKTSNSIIKTTSISQDTNHVGREMSKWPKMANNEAYPYKSTENYRQICKPSASRSIVVSSSEVSPEYREDTILSSKTSSFSTIRPLTPPGASLASQDFIESSFMSRGSIDNAALARKESDQYKPLATTTTKGGFFGLGKKTKIESIPSPPENPLVDEYLADATEREMRRRSGSIASTTMTSFYESGQPAYNTWETYRPPSPSSQTSANSEQSRRDSIVGSIASHRRTASLISTESMPHPPSASRVNKEVLASNRSLGSINPNDLLPSELNAYAGFCKGAWRQQIGDKKRAMEERVRPGGIYNAAKYLQCKQCKFEGRLVPLDKRKHGYDMRVFMLVPGIQFRWEFMFKSHIKLSESANGDPTKATFGCVFCCAEGLGTPQFDGITQFMQHLVVHRDPLPVGDVLYRMNCLVGGQAAKEDDFDINIVGKG